MAGSNNVRAADGQAAPVPALPATPSPAASRSDGNRAGNFVRESIAELRKVEWPGQSQVIQGTVVVIIACAIVGAYLWGADQLLRRLVQNVFIG